MEMKTKNIRGMRNIPTIQGLRHRSLPTTREQTVAEMARLEHEKIRLKRELNLWLDHQKRTEGQLQQVEERLAILQEIMDQTADDDSAKPAGRRRARTRRSRIEKADGEGEAQGWQEIPLEY
jgi:septal ring factor EnvC (AmiA/AmiB activator)